jgi:hypothetical protein
MPSKKKRVMAGYWAIWAVANRVNALSVFWIRAGGRVSLESRGKARATFAGNMLDEMSHAGRRPGWLLVGAVQVVQVHACFFSPPILTRVIENYQRRAWGCRARACPERRGDHRLTGIGRQAAATASPRECTHCREEC